MNSKWVATFTAFSFLLTMVFQPVALAQSPTPTTPTLQPTPTPFVPQNAPETGINVTLSPTFLSLVTDPGESVSSQFRIRNNNNFTEYFRLSLAKFEAAEGGERPLLVDLQPEDQFDDWISFSQQQFEVSANEIETIRFTLNPPESASLGYYYAILINRVQEAENADPGAVVSGSPAVLTLLEVRSPSAKRELQILDFKPEKLFYEYLPVELTVKVENTGNIHIAPVGDIFIDQGSQKDIAVLHVNEGRGNVLPNSARTFTTRWSDGFAVRVPKEENGQVVRNNDGEVVYETKFDFSKADKFRIGKYTANLLLVYDNGERDVPLEATVSFWVIPWKIILVALVVIVLVLFGLKGIITSNVKRVRNLRK